MAGVRVSDPSKLHLKKELNQIRKAARVLRDPGTTSSWKSPQSSVRSVIPVSATAEAAVSASTLKKNLESQSKRFAHQSQVDAFLRAPGGSASDEDKKTFLYNWKSHKSSVRRSGTPRNDDLGNNDDDGGDDGSSSVAGASVDDSLSDAHRGADSKSDAYLGELCSSMIFRCGDSNLLPYGTPSTRRSSGVKRKSKKHGAKLDILSRYQPKQPAIGRNSMTSKRLLEGHPSMATRFGQDDSVDQSDDTEGYSNSEDFRRVSGPSPLLLKLRHKNWPHTSSKLLRSSLREDSSTSYSTPALSACSFNKYGKRNPSTIGSWDGAATSMNDGDDEIDDHLDLPGRQGCGIPCYWSKRTPKHRGMCGSCYSPSLSDTLRRKGSNIFCGSQTVYPRRGPSSKTAKKQQRFAARSAQGILPLLTNGGDGREGSSIGTGRSDDELSTNMDELDLEALSRLDGRRWSSSCRSQEGLEIVAQNGGGDEETATESTGSFSHKYRPVFFSQLIGQNIVVQSLVNAISRGRIAPIYLFQGPRGTGKTSTARIFASALNCLAPEEAKPCGYCRECSDFVSGKYEDLYEVDGTNKKGMDKVRHLLKKLSLRSLSAFSRYKIFIIDECHLLPSKTWLTFLKFLEEPLQRVVFIFITTDLDNVPRTIQSRCQKYIFNKIKEGDMVSRLKKISTEENLNVDLDALDLIAMNADGSLRDAETMLEQLSLLGKRITTSLVNELVGVVSDEKLLELLSFTLSSDTARTVKSARELMDSGVDPIVLMSQLASLIMDIIAGTCNIVDSKRSVPIIGKQSLTDVELERLKHALKVLSEAEKRLRSSSERSTWFTATLLQLGSTPSSDLTLSGSSRRQSCKSTDDDPSSASKEATSNRQKSDNQLVHPLSSSPYNDQGDLGYNSHRSHSQFMEAGVSSASHRDMAGLVNRFRKLERLDDIWVQCIERCHSKTLRELLQGHAKLLSLSEVEGVLMAYIGFGNGDIKARAERFLSSITNSMEMVLRCNVNVKMVLFSEGEASVNGATTLVDFRERLKAEASEMERNTVNGNLINGHSNRSLLREKTYQPNSNPSELLGEGNTQTDDTRERRQELPVQRIESIIREQRLETAWLQAMEKGTPGSFSHLKPEKNQVLPQDGIYYEDQMELVDPTGASSRQWEDELTSKLKILRVNDGMTVQDQKGRKADHYVISPSLLHDGGLVGNAGKENPGYESGSARGGCSGFFCWNNTKPRRVVKVRGTPVRPRKNGRLLLFNDCRKPRKPESQLRR